jgi:RNA polymerase sigma-70 factor, ECF subfamily
MAMASRDQPGAAARELDDVTLARAIRGERPALEQLVEHHQALVWSYLWRMVRPRATRELVQDLFQETFLGVHRGLPRFSPAGAARLSTWILAIATRVTLNHLRRHRRDGDTTQPEAEASDGGAGVAGLERQGLVAALGRALAGLSPEHRAIVLLRDYHGFEYEEIARALEIELGTVASRLNRARQSLRRALAESDPLPDDEPVAEQDHD